MEEKLVTVVIPTYNRAGIIARAINSAANQTYQNLEIIVVDDGSADDTESAVRAVGDSRVRYIRQNHANGNVARNRGISEAKGEYIAFLDSDDEWTEDKLSVQISAMEENNAPVSFCGIHQISSDGKTKDILFREKQGDGFVSREFLPSVYLTTPCIVAKREVFDDFMFDPDLLKWQDWDWVVRAGEKYGFYYVRKPLLIYHTSENSISGGSSDEKCIKTVEYLREKHKEWLKKSRSGRLTLVNWAISHKVRAGIKCTDEYLEYYKITGDKSYYLRYILEKIGLLKFVKKFKRENAKTR